MPLPAYQASGTPQAGTVAETVAWPTHRVGDIALLMIESCGGTAPSLTTASGFVAITNSPQFTGAGSTGARLTIYWCRATTTSMAAVVVAAITDHQYSRILTYRYCTTVGNPWDATAGAVKATTSTTMTCPSVTTTVNNDLIILAEGHNFGAGGNITAATDYVNANGLFSSPSFVQNAGTGVGITGGISATAFRQGVTGASGTTTDAVLINTVVNAFLTIALTPVQGVAFDVATTGADYALTGSQTTSHLADAAARAACVMIEQFGTVTDEVSGVTYGGVAMTRLRFDTESTEAGGVYIYWLDGIATGTQNVIMTTTASTTKSMTVGTMICDTAVGVAGNGTGTSASVANPAWNITGLPTGVPITAFEVIHSGLAAITTTPAASWTLITTANISTGGRGFAYQDIVSNGSSTLACGWTAATADDFVGSSVAFYPLPPVQIPTDVTSTASLQRSVKW